MLSKAHHRKDTNYLKTSVGELITPLLKELTEVAQEEPALSTYFKTIHIMVERIKEHLEGKEKLERELIGVLGNLERMIDSWNENRRDNNNFTFSNTNDKIPITIVANTLLNKAVFLKSDLEKLGIEVADIYIGQPDKDASNVPSESTKLEVGESSNSSNEEDAGFIFLHQCMKKLPPHLKDCLHSLTIFPENAELKKRLLVNWWIGLGIVLRENENKTYEQLGEEYFLELVKNNVLKPVHRKHNLVIDMCTIDPTIHRQLIASCTMNEAFISEEVEKYSTFHFYQYGEASVKDNGDTREKVRALLNLDIKYLNSIYVSSKMKDVNVVQLGRWQNTKSEENKGSSKVHIEVDANDFLTEIGQSVRYLSLRGISGITKLPKSIGKLRYLRILDLKSCHNLEYLPEKPRSKLWKIIAQMLCQPQQKWFDKLRHLDISECHLLASLPNWICELYDLEVLKGFVVGSIGKTGQISRIRDLSKLKKLRKLSIKVATKHFNHADFSALEALDNLLVLTITWRINDRNDSTSALSNEKSVMNEDMAQCKDNAEDISNISEGGCEQIAKGDSTIDVEGKQIRGENGSKIVRMEKHNRENSQNCSIISRAKSKKIEADKDKISEEKKPIKNNISQPEERPRENRDSTISFPKNLVKLDIRGYPDAEAEWLNSTNLKKLKRLYIRGGNLTLITNNAPLEVEILRLRFLKKLDFDWYKLNSTFPKLKYLEYKACPRLNNFPRNRSTWITDQDGHFPSGLFDDDEDVLSPSSEINRQISNKSTIVQLHVPGNFAAPLVEIRRRVGFELSANNFPEDRDGLDLVVVLDTSGSMKGDKLEKVKSSILLLINLLSPIDRLSVVTFDTIAKRQCRLLHVTERSKAEFEDLIYSLEANGDTNTFDGLQMGLKILKDRKFSNERPVGIFLLSGGPQTIRSGDAAKVPLGNVPVHTFGLDIHQNLTVLKAIADNSIRGRFTENLDFRTDFPFKEDDDINIHINYYRYSSALAHSIDELLGQVVNALLLTFTPIDEEAKIEGVNKEMRPISLHTNDKGSVIVELGSIYNQKSVDVSLDLLLPKTDKDHRAALLQVTCSYEFMGQKFEAEPVPVYVNRMREGTNYSRTIWPESIQAKMFRKERLNVLRKLG